MTWDAARKVLGRKPFQYIEMDMGYCSNAYGVSPCLPPASSQTDSFTDDDGTDITSHTGDTGKGWELLSSAYTPKIQGNKLEIAANESLASININDTPTATAQLAEMVVSRSNSGNDGDYALAFCRATAADTFYYIKADIANDTVELGKSVSGSETVLDSYAHTFGSSFSTHLRITCAGTSITGFVDGVSALSAIDSAITATGDVGVKGQANLTPGYYYVSDFYDGTLNIYYCNFSGLPTWQIILNAIRASCLPGEQSPTEAGAVASFAGCAEAITYHCDTDGWTYYVVHNAGAGNFEFRRTQGTGYESIGTYYYTTTYVAPSAGEPLYVDDFAAQYGTPVTSVACYNTRATCKYARAYSGTTKTYRFYENRTDAPYLDLSGFPALSGAKTEPTRITPGKGLGYRASVKITLDDFTHHDRGVDPYVADRSYDPLTQGTFFGRWLARNKYYAGRTLRLYSGYLSDTFSTDDFQVREYRIEKIDGPDKNGRITVTCKDILKELDNAVAPAASNVYLTANITDSATTIPIDTTGEKELPAYRADGAAVPISQSGGYITVHRADGTAQSVALTADYEMPAYRADTTSAPIPLASTEFALGESIRVRIGSELIDATVAPGQLESATRGAGGSTAASHDSGDVVQYCIVFDSEPATDALRTVMAYAGITESLINTTGWDEQESKWLGLTTLSGTISKPTKVKKLVEMITEQGTVYIWWDERTQKIELLAVAPQADVSTLDTYTDEYNFLHDSVGVERDLREQVTQVWAYYNMLDQAGSSDPENMGALYVAADVDAESADQWNRVKPDELVCEFVRSAGHASSIASRKTGRLRDGKLTVKFNLDPKHADLWTGDEFVVNSDSMQAADGSQESVRMQVIEVRETPTGEYAYLAEASAFQGKRYAFIAPDTVSGSYAAATDDERSRYAFISSALGYMSDGEIGYNIV